MQPFCLILYLFTYDDTRDYPLSVTVTVVMCNILSLPRIPTPIVFTEPVIPYVVFSTVKALYIVVSDCNLMAFRILLYFGRVAQWIERPISTVPFLGRAELGRGGRRFESSRCPFSLFKSRQSNPFPSAAQAKHDELWYSAARPNKFRLVLRSESSYTSYTSGSFMSTTNS